MMIAAIHESNARWLEAVIRFVETMPHCDDTELSSLLNEDAPNYDLVRARLIYLALQKMPTKNLKLVTYKPPFKSNRTQMAEYAVTLLRHRHQQRLDAKRLVPAMYKQAS